MDDNMLTLQQVKDRLGVSYTTLNRYINAGEIVVVRISRNKRYITKQDLEDFMNKHTGTYK